MVQGLTAALVLPGQEGVSDMQLGDQGPPEETEDRFSLPLIITIVCMASFLLLVAALYGCCHQRLSHRKDQVGASSSPYPSGSEGAGRLPRYLWERESASCVALLCPRPHRPSDRPSALGEGAGTAARCPWGPRGHLAQAGGASLQSRRFTLMDGCLEGVGRDQKTEPGGLAFVRGPHL